MNWSRRHTLIAGLALIGLTNVVALGGAAYNRSGEPESTLILTERELRPPYAWTRRQENSGLALHLQWRVLQGDGRDALSDYSPYGGGVPAWLDAPKMASLGFDVKDSTEDMDAGRSWRYQRQLPRDVLVVLELDGPAYRESLRRATEAAKAVEAENARGEGKKASGELLEGESRRNSRLFAVDAGLDRAALRIKFPDRTKYAIVHAQVHATWSGKNNATAGFIDDLGIQDVNVPLKMRSVFEGLEPVDNAEDKRFEARLAFGQRLEPWLVSLAKR